MENEKTFKSFEDFTNLYEVQKTLRFELKPEPETDVLFKKMGVWYAEDKKRAEESTIVKFYMDLVFREFTEESLKIISLNPEKFLNLFYELKQIEKRGTKNKEDKNYKKEEIRGKKKEINDELANLRSVFVERGFDVIDQDWKIKYGDDGNKVKNKNSEKYLILSENILSYLKRRFDSQ
jgi:CRISPR-associated protein Cpf1